MVEGNEEEQDMQGTTQGGAEAISKPVTVVFNKDGSQQGTSSGSLYRCQMEGCTGRRMSVRWPDGKTTRPCTKGMTTRQDGAWQIG